MKPDLNIKKFNSNFEWEKLFDSLPDLIAVLDNKHRIVKINKAMTERLNQPQKKCIGLNCFKCVHKTNNPLKACPHSLTMADGKEHSASVFEESLNGHFFVTTTPIFDEKNKVKGSIHVMRDITERKQLEDLLQKQSKEQQAILDASPVMIFYKNKDNNFVRVNKAFQEAMGMLKEEIEGKSLFSIYSKKLAKKYWQDDLEVIKTGMPKRGIIEHMETHKGIRIVQTDKIPYLDESGNIIGVIGFGSDITERKIMEKALRESEAMYRAVVEDQTELICRYEKIEGKITFANEAYCKYYGKSPEEIIGEKYINSIPKEDRVKDKKLLLKLTSENPVGTIERRSIAGDGSVRWQSWTDRAIFDETGKIIQYQSVGKDITERKRAEESLQKLQKEMEAILENIDGGFIAIDKNWKYIYINSLAAHNLFREPEDLIGKNIWEEFPKLIGTKVETNFKKVMNKRISLHFEDTGMETGRWYENHIYPIPEGIVIFWSNITQRKQIEEDLKKNRQDLSHAQKVALMGSWRLDVKNNKLLWSDETYRIFGIPKKTELSYEKFISMVHKNDRSFVNNKWKDALAGKTYDIEHRIITRGKIRWVRERAELELNNKGELLGGFGTVQDITRQKRIQKKLDHLASFPQLNPNPILEFDLKGRLLFYNNSALNVLGKHNFPKKAKQFLPSDFEKIASIFKKDSAKILNREVEIDGITFLETLNFVSQAKTVRIYSQDITYRKQAEEEKNNFIAIMSHELRNPLTPILSGIQILKDIVEKGHHGNLYKSDIIETANTIEQQSKNLSRLLDDLLDITRISRGKIILKKQIISLCDCINSAIKAVEPLMKTQGHSFKKYMPKCPIFLEADPVRLEQIIINILNNAIKYTPPNGKIELLAQKIGNEAVISIKDNGIGIDPKKMSLVFDLFAREGNPFVTTLGELGIGLKLTKDLVDLHKGTIIPKCKGINQGCEFIVKLPCLPTENLKLNTHKNEEKTTSKKLKVLVVDDNIPTANLISKAIKMFGHDSLPCNDGKTAMSKIKTFKPDVAFIDIGMPMMNGYETALEIRKMQKNNKNKITLVALTGYGQESDKEKSKKAGFDIHLVKPVELNKIKSVLSEIN